MYGQVIIHAKRAQCVPHRGDTHLTLFRSKLHPGVKVYHVGLLAENEGNVIVLEHGPINARLPAAQPLERVMQLPGVELSLQELLDYQDTLPKHYLIGVRDCRHHVIDVLNFCYPLT